MESSPFLAGFGEFLLYRLDSLPTLALVAVVVTAVFARLAPRLQRWFPRLWPHEREDRQSFLTDILYLLASPISQVIAAIMTSTSIALGAIVIGRRADLSAFSGFGPVMRQPYWLMLLECFVLADLMSYWTHRAAHSVPALWRLHATHHSVEHIRGLSFVRFHPLEVWELVPNLTVLFLLGFPVDALAPVGPAAQIFAFFIHSKSRIAPRWLSYVLTFPAYHRWHHAKYIEGNGWNFGGMFPILDVVFGTYYYPKHEPEALGIVDADMPKTFWAQLVYPFRRARARPLPELTSDLHSEHRPSRHAPEPRAQAAGEPS